MDVEVIKRSLMEQAEIIALKHVKSTLDKLVDIPTVSAWGDFHVMREGANTVASILRELGFKVDVVSAGGYPAVLAETGSGDSTVLVYNHYDVQPPDPLELWDSDPFKLSERDGKLYGRGVADNKGNIAARIAAMEILAPYLDKLGLTVKFIVEGEEEIGSPTLEKIVMERLEWFKADGGIWETAYVRRDGRLSISLGFKGMVYVELKVRGASRDVHSGYSPLIPNPALRIARLLLELKDERSGKVLIPGFYDGVDLEFLRIGEELLSKVDVSELETMKEELGLREFVGGLSGLEALKALHLSPSLNISGLYSGYTGKGSKTIVPSEAGAKIDIRLVPGQDPRIILDSLVNYIKVRGFDDVEVYVESMYRSGFTKPDEDIVKASVDAGKYVYGVEPQLLPMAAGSGPIYIFTDIARTPMTGAGVGYYGSRVHAPNENIRLEDFIKGVKHVALTLVEFATRRGIRKHS